MSTSPPVSRRFVLRAAGAILPLPFLASLGCAEESMGGSGGAGNPGTRGAGRGEHPLVIVRAASGVAQEDEDEPELWWPHELGPLTSEILGGRDADRCTSELADFASRLLLVRGTKYPFNATRELHAGGGNQLLTAARCGPTSDSVMTYAMGESIDNWIARRSDVNGGEPLTLYAGRRDNYGEEVLSYRGPQELRGAESDPWRVYNRLLGTGGVVGLRRSVNDLVLDQLDALYANPRLSRDDRHLLEMHTDSVRDFEAMACRLSSEVEDRMLALEGQSASDELSLEVAKAHCDLIAIVLSCGNARAVTLQIGDRLDRCRYVARGQELPPYHQLSHRLVDPEDLGVFEHAYEMHAEVNRLHLGVFHHLLSVLDERGLLDDSVTVFCSDVTTGSHRYDEIPWIIAGTGDGTLGTGQYVDAGDQTHDKLLATLLTATGHRMPDGAPITQFGDESLEGGLLDAILA